MTAADFVGAAPRKSAPLSKSFPAEFFLPNLVSATARNPGLLRGMMETAARCHDAGQLAEAEERCRRILAIDGRHADSLHLLGVVALKRGQLAASLELLNRAIRLRKDNPFYHASLGLTLMELGRFGNAAASLERAVALDPRSSDFHNDLGRALAARGLLGEAVAHFEDSLAINPGKVEALNNLGCALKELGRFEEAIAHFQKAVGIRPDCAEVHYNLAEIRTFHPNDGEITALERLAASKTLPRNKAVYVHFALGKAFEDTGNYTRAFNHLFIGNTLKRTLVRYDEARAHRLFCTVSDVFDKSLLNHFEGAGDPSGIPIFVVGMPRSGSTLVEQILASHPLIHTVGETGHLDAAVASVLSPIDPRHSYPEILRDLDPSTLRRIGQAYLRRLPALPGGKTRIVDKLPANFMNIGLIRLILPNAKIIHTVRNAADTCVSCYSKLFTTGQSFSYNLAELGRYYRRYADLTRHWRSVLPESAVHEVVYEDVVDDLEGQGRKLAAYCGLPWNESCLEFHKNERAVSTASSVQVRKPLFRTSLERWRRYEPFLGPLLAELR